MLAALGQFGGERTAAIYVRRDRDTYDAEPFSSIHKELAACLGGHVLMGPLFGTPILLVEGDDDYRIWSQVPRHHVTNLAVIPSHGEEIMRYQKALEKIFSSLRENQDVPCGFALLDGDKGIPMPNPDNPQAHIRFIRLACHEAENLYLSDEVLAELGTDWGQAATAIVARAHEFGNKQAMLESAVEWDRKDEDIKTVIEEVALILDPKPIHWTVRVGRVLGRAKPGGHLAALLGEDVTAALWFD